MSMMQTQTNWYMIEDEVQTCTWPHNGRPGLMIMHPFTFARYKAFTDVNQGLELLRKFLHQDIDRKFEGYRNREETLRVYKETGFLIERRELNQL